MLIFHVSILTTTKENSLNLSLILFQRGKLLPKMSNHGIQFIFKTQFWLVFFLSFYQMWRRLLSIVQILYCKHSEFFQGICDMKISDTGEQLMAAQISIQLTNINGNSASNVPTVSRYNCAKDAAIKESTAPAMKKDKNKIHISMQIEIDVWHYY